MAIQNSGWPGNDYKYEYGYNLWGLRWCGILQRIAYGYATVALMELWIPKLAVPACLALRSSRDSSLDGTGTGTATFSDRLRLHLQVVAVHGYKWALVLLSVAVYLALLYGTHVPSWTVTRGSETGQWDALTDTDVAKHVSGQRIAVANTTGQSVHRSNWLLRPPKRHTGTEIVCDVRGELSPSCSAAGYFDRLIFGQKMCKTWMSKRLPACSSCSPGDHIYSTGANCSLISARLAPPNLLSDASLNLKLMDDAAGHILSL